MALNHAMPRAMAYLQDKVSACYIRAAQSKPELKQSINLPQAKDCAPYDLLLHDHLRSDYVKQQENGATYPFRGRARSSPSRSGDSQPGSPSEALPNSGSCRRRSPTRKGERPRRRARRHVASSTWWTRISSGAWARIKGVPAFLPRRPPGGPDRRGKRQRRKDRRRAGEGPPARFDAGTPQAGISVPPPNLPPASPPP